MTRDGALSHGSAQSRDASPSTTGRPKSGDDFDADGRHRAVYVISVAAELTGVHPQTLRVYERKGLISPARTGGMSRRYSDADLEQIRRVLTLTAEGMNLIGVARVLQLEAEVVALKTALAEQTSTALVPLRSTFPRP